MLQEPFLTALFVLVAGPVVILLWALCFYTLRLFWRDQ